MRTIARFNILGDLSEGERDVEAVLVVEYGASDGPGFPIGFQVERRPVDRTTGELGPATWAYAWSNARLAMACALGIVGFDGLGDDLESIGYRR